MYIEKKKIGTDHHKNWKPLCPTKHHHLDCKYKEKAMLHLKTGEKAGADLEGGANTEPDIYVGVQHTMYCTP